MRLRRRPGDTAALREEARGLVAILYYAAALGGGHAASVTRARLVEIADTVGWPAPPPLTELVEDPRLIDGWAAQACGAVWG
ncbi:hypothetical protein [Thermostaphylospora chromogena]|uniref:Uncharacterized protein n=1 Tax=Thermostaphylospora chromogena TaxID=35622 RepID=A0A1H1CWE6_9ACTN|nr:hypothetical protein [Thermostaphylospora chromogena]SDQ68601.1 hypothetical protein SAMN04489764_1689 [Thermostaphylospora chromogena]